jgi:hypothetical protein
MNHDLLKFHHWLLSSTFKSQWFEENIKHQILSVLSWIIYPEFRKQNSLISVIKKNKFIITLFSVILFWSTSFFTFGRLTSETEKKVVVVERTIKINDYLKNVDFTSLRSERRFIEYLTYSKFKIGNYDNLQKLPDEIFFTIISEINQRKIPPSIFFRLIDQESAFTYVTNKNSKTEGYCQVHPQTKISILNIIGTTNHERIDNIRIASYHLKSQYDKYRSEGFEERESWIKSLVDYNGGSISLAKSNMLHFSKVMK